MAKRKGRNTRKKGTQNRTELKEALEGAGWLVAVVERTGKFTVDRDAFGLFDLLAIRRGVCRLIQTTTNRNHGHGPYRTFAMEHANERVSVEQWVRHDGVNQHKKAYWVSYDYTAGGEIVRTNGREV